MSTARARAAGGLFSLVWRLPGGRMPGVESSDSSGGSEHPDRPDKSDPPEPSDG
jgi:hypothetical protein